MPDKGGIKKVVAPVDVMKLLKRKDLRAPILRVSRRHAVNMGNGLGKSKIK